jgi:lipopolysaccharide transport system ATP-binding protein
VVFAEIEKFLDTPVKYYSSGMYVRLAFAVAAHLEPEILVVDEVLAVGDAEFQKKCLGKMGDVAHEGRTVLFVSHNMGAVLKLCSRGLYLENGCLKAFGSITDIIARYISNVTTENYSNPITDESPRIVAAKILNLRPSTDQTLEIEVEWYLPDRIHNVRIGIGFNTVEGQRIFDSIPEDSGVKIPEKKGKFKAIVRVPPNTFLARHYIVSIGLWKPTPGARSIIFDHQETAMKLIVEASPKGAYAYQETRDGLIHTICDWKIL